MKFKISLFLLIFLCISIVSAQQVSLQLNPIIDSNNLKGGVSTVSEYSSSKELISEQIVSISANNTISFSLSKKTSKIVITIDLPETPSVDFFGKLNIQNDLFESEKIIILPTGTMDLTIVDKNGRPVKDVSVRIDCEKRYGVQGRFITDEFGVIKANYLPVGNCNIRAAYGDSFKTSNININQGETIQQEIKFSSLKLKTNKYSIVSIIIFLVILSILAIYFLRKKDKPTIKKEKSTKEPNTELFSVLSKKEVLILEFLINVTKKESRINNKTKSEIFVSQSKIVHEAGIPKTSLTRVLHLLESKKLIIIEHIGKSKRIYLSSKILNK